MPDTDGAGPNRARLRIATLNIRNTADRWAERRKLLSTQLAELRPDVIGVQELRRWPSQARWTKKRLDDSPRAGPPYQCHSAGKTGLWGLWEGIAVFTRVPVLERGSLDLGGDHRVANWVQVQLADGATAEVYNAHLSARDGALRDRQAGRLLDHMAARGDVPKLLVGDLNATPGSSTLGLLGERRRARSRGPLRLRSSRHRRDGERAPALSRPPAGTVKRDGSSPNPTVPPETSRVRFPRDPAESTLVTGQRGVDVVVGAGHNGLVAACYLARAGRQVVVVEQLDRPGGGSRTEETVPGYRFDLHSAAHNIINMTDIPAELDLAGAGLDYIEMDPFSIAVHADGRRVRFFRSMEATVESIAEESPEEAQAYRRFLDKSIPIVRTVMPAIRGEMSLKLLPAKIGHVVRALRRQPLTTARDVMSPYDALLRRWLPSDLTRGPVAAFAAHAGVGPTVPGGSLFAFWQAAYHLFGQWHGRGGAQNLTDALVARLRSLGGELRCSAPVARIESSAGRVRAVVLEDGERITAANVITAIDPKVALLEMLDPPLGGDAGADLAAARRSNVVQAVVHVATDALPAYANSRHGDWNGLQGYVDRLGDLTTAWNQSEAGRLPDPLPLYAFTPSALDDALAPSGHHTVYLACPAAPARIEGGWARRRDELVQRCLDTVEARAPGFGASVQGIATWTPDDMERVERWPLGHPMYLDIALDQLGPFRPTKRLGQWRTPVEGLYISGAGTNPSGGIAGTPGRQAARTLLSDQ